MLVDSDTIEAYAEESEKDAIQREICAWKLIKYYQIIIRPFIGRMIITIKITNSRIYIKNKIHSGEK